jgi:cysteine-rich repeat protein
MTRTRTVVPAGPAAILGIVAGLVLAPATGRAIDATCAVQAATDLAVGPACQLAGDVAATEAGGRVRLSHGVDVGDGTVVLGDLVQLGPASSVDDVEANTLKLGRGVAIRGTRGPATLPVLDPPCSVAPIDCGGSPVSVPKRGAQTLRPGRYGSVRIDVGGTLELAAGHYEFCTLTMGRRGTLETTAGAATTIAVAGPLRAGVGAYVGPSDGIGLPAIDVDGRVRFSTRSRVSALLSAPGWSLDVGPGSDLTGRFCAGDVHLSNRVRLACPAVRDTTTTIVVSTSTTTSSSTTSTSSSSTTTVSSTSSSTAPSSTSSTSTSSTTSSSTSSSSTSSTSSSSTSVPTTSSTTTSTSTSSTTTTVPGLCGNGVIDPGETCDDGNTSNADTCPSDCVIDACTPIVGGTLVSAVLSFQSPGVPLAGFSILIDYPEGKLDYASAVPLVSGFFPPQDYGHALLVIRAAASGIDPGPVLRTRYNACQGAPAATNADFGCEVLEAVDDATNLVDGVTCTVTLE